MYATILFLNAHYIKITHINSLSFHDYSLLIIDTVRKLVLSYFTDLKSSEADLSIDLRQFTLILVFVSLAILLDTFLTLLLQDNAIIILVKIYCSSMDGNTILLYVHCMIDVAECTTPKHIPS